MLLITTSILAYWQLPTYILAEWILNFDPILNLGT